MPTTAVVSTPTSTTTPLPTTMKPTSYKDLDIPNYNVKSTTKKTSMFHMFWHALFRCTVGSLLRTGLCSRIFGCKSNRHKTSTI
jgi:hypothetical protein